MKRVLESENNMVHYGAPPAMDQVALCGMTDRIGLSDLQETNKRCTCWGCRQIVKYVRGRE